MTHSSKDQGFQLTEDDVNILIFVYECRVVHVGHLMALTGRSQRKLNGRLLKLAEHGYLYRLRFSRYEKFLYTINKSAASTLVERGIAPKELIDVRVRMHELTEMFLKHRLMIVDIHVALLLACRDSSIRLTQWEEGRELYDSVKTSQNGTPERLPVRPDALFTLDDTSRTRGEARAHFFLEADRSTATHKRFQSKTRAYWNYFTQGLAEKKYGFKTFRVLTVTLTPERAENLCDAAGDVLPTRVARFHYFAPITHFALENIEGIFDEIFFTPRDYEEGVRYALMPPLAEASFAS